MSSQFPPSAPTDPVTLASYMGSPNLTHDPAPCRVTLVQQGPQDPAQASGCSVFRLVGPMTFSGITLSTWPLLHAKLRGGAGTCLLHFSAGMSCCSPQTPCLAWTLAPASGLGSRGSSILLGVLTHPGGEDELMPGGDQAQPLPIGAPVFDILGPISHTCPAATWRPRPSTP